MHPTNRTDEALFDHAVPMAVARRFSLVRSGNLSIMPMALLVVVIAWLPLVILAGLQSLATGTDEVTSLLREVGVHARYMFAAPLLVLAAAVCGPRLNVIAHHFGESGI